MEHNIDINAIPKAPRYIYTAEYIFTNPYYTASVFLKTNEKANFHIQEFYEICIISRGEGYHVIEETVVKAKRGDVFIVPPGSRHAIIGGEGFDIHYIHLHPDFIRRYSPIMKSLPSFLSLFEIEPLMRINGTLYRHLYLEESALSEVLEILTPLLRRWQHDPITQISLESYLMVVFTIFCREYEKLQTTVGKNASNDKHFMDSISHVIENYNRKITIDDLAHISGLSRTAYIKRFREVTGKSPKRFINKRRIAEAKKLLLSTDRSISKIAEDTGFYDAAHFIKAFTSEVGLSPSVYRAQNP